MADNNSVSSEVAEVQPVAVPWLNFSELGKDLTRGLWDEVPLFRLVLGTCPTLAVSTSVINGVGMGAAVTFVLIASNVMISMLRRIIPDEVRIPVFIIVIASFVTIVDLMMAAFTPDLHHALGIFIPLIVVNCILLARAEAFASRYNVIRSAIDGLGMGLGFTFALVLLGTVREILGNGTWLGLPVFSRIWGIFGYDYQPMIVMILPPGAFIGLGLLVALRNKIDAVREKKGVTYGS